MSNPSLGRLFEQVKRHGISEVFRRMSKRTHERLADRFGLRELDFPLRSEDIGDSGTLNIVSKRVVKSDVTRADDRFLNVGWVCTPPGQGSGGHTTLFRMVAAMMEKGHRCTILLYDKNSDDVRHHIETIRTGWPWLSADIKSATSSTEFLDVAIASSWQSAHVLASRMSAVPYKLYFIQDYEPYFYPRGQLYALAEDTYKFGFRNIALGRMVAESIRLECGAPIYATVSFGCDDEIYHLIPKPSAPIRNGVVFYAKKNTDRRGYLLGKQALEIFGLKNPGQTIHVYGDSVSGWSVPIINHGNLMPEALNSLYNSTIASLAMSFTNISLVVGELISAGNIPVMNDSEMARLDMKSPYAVWASATPFHLSSALERTVTHPDIMGRAEAVGRSRQPTWRESQDQLCKIIEQNCFEQRSDTIFGQTVEHE